MFKEQKQTFDSVMYSTEGSVLEKEASVKYGKHSASGILTHMKVSEECHVFRNVFLLDI